jgi:hypothetical protein
MATLKEIKAELNAAYKRPEAHPFERLSLLMRRAVIATKRKHKKLKSLNSGKVKMVVKGVPSSDAPVPQSIHTGIV